MDFFEHEERARRKTSLLVIYFLIAVALIIISVYLAVAGLLFYGQSKNSMGGPPPTLWFPDVFAAVSLGTLAIITAGSMYKTAMLAGGGEVVARSLGGRPIATNTRDLREKVLLNVVEEMAIASGTPVPPVFLLEDEEGINAFAAGTTPQNAVIGITRGTIETLSRDELQGVIAHEFSHILNGDMRLNIRLIGTLNGILLIAIAGYILMRTTSYSSRSSDDDRKGGNPLPLLGLCLYIIGYVGVFFGHLIKSAVSRQREFLADASAVQFTRYPDGIAGALKKIGGLEQGSRLAAPNAEEASHMFFGNGVAQPFFDMLATHPPLVERIRRIDPTFDGNFPPAQPIDYSARDVVDPHTLAARRAEPGRAAVPVLPGAPPMVQGVVLAAGASMAFDPRAAVAQVGAPRAEHLDFAAKVMASLPAELTSHVHDPLGAVATIYALLLDDGESDVRQKQLEYLSTKANPRVNQETLRMVPLVAQVDPQAKLPLVSLTLPALNSLSPQQLAAFRDDVTFLIKADNRLSIFEYAVQRLVLKRMLPRLERRPRRAIQYNDLTPLLPACGALLSAIAYVGTRDDDEASRAFHLGEGRLPAAKAALPMVPRNQSGFKSLDAALDQLAGANPAIKKGILEACAACIGADGRITIEEGELLRVIADGFNCPMPPLAVDLQPTKSPKSTASVSES